VVLLETFIPVVAPVVAAGAALAPVRCAGVNLRGFAHALTGPLGLGSAKGDIPPTGAGGCTGLDQPELPLFLLPLLLYCCSETGLPQAVLGVALVGAEGAGSWLSPDMGVSEVGEDVPLAEGDALAGGPQEEISERGDGAEAYRFLSCSALLKLGS